MSEPRTFEPGVYDIDERTYRRAVGQNWSTIKHARLASPRRARVEQLHPRDPWQSVTERAVHARTLTPDRFGSEFAVMPPGMGRRRAADKAWICDRELEGLQVLTAAEGQLVEQLSAAVAAHPLAGRLLRASSCESAVFWQESIDFEGEVRPTTCKAKLDGFAESFEGLDGEQLGTIVWDLKCSPTADPRAWVKIAARWAWQGQLAMYSHGLARASAAAGRPVSAERAWWVVVDESCGDVTVVECPEDALAAGHRVWSEALVAWQVAEWSQVFGDRWNPAIAHNVVWPSWSAGMGG